MTTSGDRSRQGACPPRPPVRAVPRGLFFGGTARNEMPSSSVGDHLGGVPGVSVAVPARAGGEVSDLRFVGLGLVICWGYAGILSLGQGIFFGIGGYCMAMFLKLEASDKVSTQSSRRRGFRTSWTGIS